MIRLSIISADFRPSFSPVIPPTKAPEIDPMTKILAVKYKYLLKYFCIYELCCVGR